MLQVKVHLFSFTFTHVFSFILYCVWIYFTLPFFYFYISTLFSTLCRPGLLMTHSVSF